MAGKDMHCDPRVEYVVAVSEATLTYMDMYKILKAANT